MKRTKVVTLVILLMAFLLVGTSLFAKLTYGYVTPGPDTWYKKDVEGFRYAASLVGADVIVLNSDYDTEKEITNIKTLINMGVDGMCVFSFNPNGAFIAARECALAGIPLVVTDNVGQVLKSDYDVVACIDFDWHGMGINVANYIAEHYPGEKIASIMGLFEHVPVQIFRSAFEPRVNELGINQIVAVRDGKYTPTVAVDQAQDLIESGYDFSVLFIFNEEMAAAVVRMLKTRGLLNNPIKVITTNGAPYGIELIKEGSIKYSISTSPGWEGFVSFLALHAYTQGLITELNQQILLPNTPITPETIDDKTKVVPWDIDPIWIDLTRQYFPQYNPLY
ncbi:MAG: sugar ABC transporter substrate-binding protein [Kosmotoga sp.]|uniref:sugar ABC transporter substrate-binding protein n=1 Tax=Kosmotoga sp. TaxID=1955248 RepID=UPI001E065E7C|nr:sugar ABC transporter substrate-binding protein [Kosmotoga sp.]MBO8167313.1 sugar ABC transporter substrate-binding protein [Kosmotoga sp.]